MAGNSIGNIFKVSTFGESHGTGIGGIIDGCPPNIIIDIDFIENELRRRSANDGLFETARVEMDQVEFFSGVFEKKTLGTPIGFMVKNSAQISSDYKDYKNIYRPSHADYTYQQKYGIRDYRGGGRSSGRETVARVVAGAIAKIILKNSNISCLSYVSQIGKIKMKTSQEIFSISEIETSAVRCPEKDTTQLMLEELERVKNEGNTLGGIITLIITNCPRGLGEPIFDKFNADLAKALFSIGAVKGVEFGDGFDIASKKGSEVADLFYLNNKTEDETYDKIGLKSNHSGGTLGGITNGENIVARIAFKPVPTLSQEQKFITDKGTLKSFCFKGRHDVCMVPRAVPIVESMAAIITLDHLLRHNSYKNL